jgi:hypothetical protein
MGNQESARDIGKHLKSISTDYVNQNNKDFKAIYEYALLTQSFSLSSAPRPTFTVNLHVLERIMTATCNTQIPDNLRHPMPWNSNYYRFNPLVAEMFRLYWKLVRDKNLWYQLYWSICIFYEQEYITVLKEINASGGKVNKFDWQAYPLVHDVHRIMIYGHATGASRKTVFGFLKAKLSCKSDYTWTNDKKIIPIPCSRQSHYPELFSIIYGLWMRENLPDSDLLKLFTMILSDHDMITDAFVPCLCLKWSAVYYMIPIEHCIRPYENGENVRSKTTYSKAMTLFANARRNYQTQLGNVLQKHLPIIDLVRIVQEF